MSTGTTATATPLTYDFFSDVLTQFGQVAATDGQIIKAYLGGHEINLGGGPVMVTPEMFSAAWTAFKNWLVQVTQEVLGKEPPPPPQQPGQQQPQ